MGEEIEANHRGSFRKLRSQGKNNSFYIFGGLGNQIFQFVAGLYFAQETGRKVTFRKDLLDRWGENHGQDIGNLFEYEFKNNQANKKLLKRHLQLMRKINQHCDSILLSKFSRTYISPQIGFDSSLNRVASGISILGYFQSYKYFESLVLKPKMVFNYPANTLEPINLRETDLDEVITIHIRRGDYMKRKNEYGLLSASYYEHGLEILDPERSRKILIFSDDMELAEFVLRDSSYRENMILVRGLSSLATFSIISKSHHIIISNSTFSYWAAMFAGESAQVIAPEKWYEGMADPIDLLPPRWKKIASEWEI